METPVSSKISGPLRNESYDQNRMVVLNANKLFNNSVAFKCSKQSSLSYLRLWKAF